MKKPKKIDSDYDKAIDEMSDEDIEAFQKELEKHDTSDYDDSYIKDSEERARKRSLRSIKAGMTMRKRKEARMVQGGF
jgi:hypothetical protein